MKQGAGERVHTNSRTGEPACVSGTTPAPSEEKWERIVLLAPIQPRAPALTEGGRPGMQITQAETAVSSKVRSDKSVIHAWRAALCPLHQDHWPVEQRPV